MVELPIACSLDVQQSQERRREWGHLISEALRSQAATPTGVKLAFSANRDVEHRLEHLVELERDCCAFARWTLTHDGDEIVLRVDGQGEGVAAIQELFQR